jgi:hypothetical protein
MLQVIYSFFESLGLDVDSLSFITELIEKVKELLGK